MLVFNNLKYKCLAMKPSCLLLTLALGMAGTGLAQTEYDDIYYVAPARNTQSKPAAAAGTTLPGTNYVPDMSAVDIDAYNRRGEYSYTSPLDTIGAAAGAADDFVYTQQIQQYINPTIVVDNQDALQQILNGTYGNVNVIYNGMTPYLLPTYYARNWPNIFDTTLPFYWRSWTYRYGASSPWMWSALYSYIWNMDSPWGPNWGWAPFWGSPWTYYWNTWNPWGWGCYYPYYNWGWHHPRHNRHWAANHWRPGMTQTSGARPGWSGHNRPGYTYGRPGSSGSYGGGNGHRPVNPARPGNGNGNNNHRPGIVNPGVSGNTTATARPNPAVNPGRPGYNHGTNTGTTAAHRPGTSATATTRPDITAPQTQPGVVSGGNNGTNTGNGGHRPGASSQPYRYTSGSQTDYHRYSSPAGTGTTSGNRNGDRYNGGNHRPSSSSGSYSGSSNNRYSPSSSSGHRQSSSSSSYSTPSNNSRRQSSSSYSSPSSSSGRSSSYSSGSSSSYGGGRSSGGYSSGGRSGGGGSGRHR